MAALKKGTWGGKRKGSGRPRGATKPDARRNRLVVLLSDRELEALNVAASGDPISTYARRLLLRDLERQGALVRRGHVARG